MFTPKPYASSDERDTQDTSPEEPRQERDMQDTPVRSLETRNATRLEGTLSRHVVAIGCSSQPGRSRASSSSIHRPCSVDEERGEIEGEEKIKER